MWARQFQTCHRRVPLSAIRHWRRQQSTGPHKTYFQQPPEPPTARGSFWRYAALGTVCAGAGYVAAIYYSLPMLDQMQYGDIVPFGTQADAGGPQVDLMIKLGSLAWHSSVPSHIDLDVAQDLLSLFAGVSVQERSIVHNCSLSSNMPCEDVTQSGGFSVPGPQNGQWQFAAIYDGHAGGRCANALYDSLVSSLAADLYSRGCLKRAYRPNDPNITRVIKSTFEKVDQTLVSETMKKIQEDAEDRAYVTALSSVAFAGSCALIALFDPVNSVVRVANVGDSRAVLGRWDDSQQRYIAMPLSNDHTGFNPSEVSRLAKEHPGENVIDPATGRLHGLAVTRAFGDSRWKWPQEISHRANKLFFGPKPRPDEVIKTPPYLTAEPEIMETRIDETSSHPDFLILASDGLWDQMSSDDAVTCIQMWLDKHSPVDVSVDRLEDQDKFQQYLRDGGSPADYEAEQQRSRPRSFLSADELAGEYDEKADTYFDAEENVMKWRTRPEHFVVEDAHAGVHLIKNALGGKRRNLFTQVMSVMPPHSRKVRDDISVFVWFFGQDTEALEKRAQALGDEGGEGGQKKGWLW